MPLLLCKNELATLALPLQQLESQSTNRNVFNFSPGDIILLKSS